MTVTDKILVCRTKNTNGEITSLLFTPSSKKMYIEINKDSLNFSNRDEESGLTQNFSVPMNWIKEAIKEIKG